MNLQDLEYFQLISTKSIVKVRLDTIALWLNYMIVGKLKLTTTDQSLLHVTVDK